MKKRISLLLLALLMALSLLPLQALALGAPHTAAAQRALHQAAAQAQVGRSGALNTLSAYSSNVGKKAVFNPLYIEGGSFFISDAPENEQGWAGADVLFGSKISPECTVVIEAVYDNGIEYWYKVSAAPGHTLPAELSAQPWVFQNLIGDSAEYDSLLIREEPPLPAAPANPCACCEKCTGGDACFCGCEGCLFAGEVEAMCTCGHTEALEHHAHTCPIRRSFTELYAHTLSAAQISAEWPTLERQTREDILALLEDEAPEKLGELLPLLPDMTVHKTAELDGAQVSVSGDIPQSVQLSACRVQPANYHPGLLMYLPDLSAVLYAADLTLHAEGSGTWQPWNAEPLDVSLDAAAIGLADEQRVRIFCDHEGELYDLGAHTVSEGQLTFPMGRFSVIYVIPVESAVQNAADQVIYFDLNAGSVTISGKNYTGYRFDGSDTAKEVTGTLAAGQSYYIYQSNAENKAQTGLFEVENPDGTIGCEMRLPNYPRVESWASFITDNTDIEGTGGIIAQWKSRAAAAGRTATVNKVALTGSQKCTLVIEDLWSTFHEKGSNSISAGLLFTPSGSGSTLTLQAKGDNRFGKIHYYATQASGNRLIFAGEEGSTITVANMEKGSGKNYWRAAIGANDGSDSAAGLVFNSGCIYAGTTAQDDCTAIGGGGNGFGGVTINGGTVTAVASSSGAAIGGGIGKTSNGGQAEVKINGGNVYAYNFSCLSGSYSQTGVKYIPAAAIGGGSSARAVCKPCTVQITGGNVFARSVGGTAIGGGSSADTHGGASTVAISGGTLDVASMAGTVGGYAVKAGASIGGGTGGTKGSGGNCTLSISGTAQVFSGSIGGGKTLDTTGANTIGSAWVQITGGTLQGQVIMASGAADDCSFTMSGGIMDNTAALSGTLNADGDLEFEQGGTGTYHTYTFLEENGGAVHVDNGIATLSGGTVRNAEATNGGAFYVSGGRFNMSGGTIEQVHATEYGGAVCTVSGGEFEMTGGTVRAFTAQKAGGAVYVLSGTAKVGGAIEGSRAVTEAQKGGAVYVGGGTFEMTGGSIKNCSASEMGGAVCVEMADETAGIAKVVSGTISDVHAPNGGAIAVSGGSFTMENGSISDVLASSDGTAANGLGGAVYVSDGSVAVTGGTITGHPTAPEAGSGGGVYVQGGTFVMSGGSMTHFSATGNGGMVCVTGEGAEASIRGGTISGNPAAGINEAANGGAVYVSAGGSFAIEGQGNIENCSATQSGGGVYLDNGTFTVAGGTFKACTAAKDGGGVYMGGGTLVMNGGSFETCAAAQFGGGVYMGGGTFEMGGSGSFEACTAEKDGGGIYLSGGTFEMPGGSVQACSAVNGGGVYMAGGIFNMDGGTFADCRAQANGGAVCITNGTANIKGGTIEGDNTVTGSTITPNLPEAVNGGGIYVGGGKLDMEAGTITKCSATSGGAAYITAGECNMTGGSVSYNRAADGGAMYVVNTPVVYGGLNDLTVDHNAADQNGGGMFISNVSGKTTTITNGLIRNNTAGLFGGGIFHKGAGGSCTVTGAGQILANTAANGGGLYVIEGSSLNVSGGHITENKAIGQPAAGVTTAADHSANIGVGGGVYVGPGTTVSSSGFTMQAGMAAGIYANTADFAADDIYANSSATVLSLPAVDGMVLGGSMTATGWYCDYAEGDTGFDQNTLIVPGQFPNPEAVTAGTIERYRQAVLSETAPYLVNQSLQNVSGKYICLTIGSDIINFGTIVIEHTAPAEDQYYIFRIEATSLQNASLELPVFEAAIRGSGSVTIGHVPFGSYKITAAESWAWRYETANGQPVQQIAVNDPDTPVTVSFVSRADADVAYDDAQQQARWLDGSSRSKLNVWNRKNPRSLLQGIFGGKGGER